MLNVLEEERPTFKKIKTILKNELKGLV